MTEAAETSAFRGPRRALLPDGRAPTQWAARSSRVRPRGRTTPAHWDVAAAADLGYPDVVAPLTFTSTPRAKCNRRMFESIVVGYDTYPQTEGSSSSTARSSPGTN